MLFYALGAFSVVIFGLASAQKHTLPITTCRRDSANYSTCLKRSLDEAWPRFVAGIPEFDFPSLDPLVYKYGKIIINSGEIHGEVILSNISAVGMSETRFSDIRTHFLDDVFRLEIDTFIPKLFIEGVVKMDGGLSTFRINGQGPFNLTTHDVRSTWDLIGHVVNDTWIVEHFHQLPSIEKFKAHFDLFQDNKGFNDFVVTFVNEFWPPLYRVMLPAASNIWDPWLTNYSNYFFSKVSFSKIFP
ncbi:uncharacterized protein LOC105830084 [Monomorium pharaonis]|uniref:uncharacterized protein LOC105830084 n=1 Tax=Monomorium pharaonis TaxID=307658 RepID=UPI00063ED864|nr:uncharacterized protein LOC105830084 [Monomorium pharaonis]